MNFTTIFFKEFCNDDMNEEMEMDTDTLYLLLAGNNLYDCIQEDKKEVWEFLRNEDWNDYFVMDSSGIFFPRTCFEKHNQSERGLFKEESRCTEMSCL